MTERDAFLQAIAENPEDESIPLIFADWLEEHDEGPLADSIRKAMAIAKLSMWGLCTCPLPRSGILRHGTACPYQVKLDQLVHEFVTGEQPPKYLNAEVTDFKARLTSSTPATSSPSTSAAGSAHTASSPSPAAGPPTP